MELEKNSQNQRLISGYFPGNIELIFKRKGLNDCRIKIKQLHDKVSKRKLSLGIEISKGQCVNEIQKYEKTLDKIGSEIALLFGKTVKALNSAKISYQDVDDKTTKLNQGIG